MSNEWIKIEHTTPEKPEVLHMAEMLKIDPDAVFGKLVRLWIWGENQKLDQQHQERSQRSFFVPKAFLDTRAKVPGFADAMLNVGWLTESDDGNVSFSDFTKHSGKAAKSKALSAKRKDDFNKNAKRTKKERSHRSNKNARSVPKIARPSFLVFSSLNELPEDLRTEEFLKEWKTWIDYRDAIKKRLTEHSVKQQLKDLAAIGVDRAVAMIRHTISKGWTGLREPDQRQVDRRKVSAFDFIKPEVANGK